MCFAVEYFYGRSVAKDQAADLGTGEGIGRPEQQIDGGILFDKVC